MEDFELLDRPTLALTAQDKTAAPLAHEPDIWRAASILLKRYGAEAVFIASKRANALLDQGDHHGCSTWIRIAKAITELERKQAGKADRIH